MLFKSFGFSLQYAPQQDQKWLLAYNDFYDTANDNLDAWITGMFTVVDSVKNMPTQLSRTPFAPNQAKSYVFVPLFFLQLKGIMDIFTMYSHASADQYLLIDTRAQALLSVIHSFQTPAGLFWWE